MASASLQSTRGLEAAAGGAVGGETTDGDPTDRWVGTNSFLAETVLASLWVASTNCGWCCRVEGRSVGRTRWLQECSEPLLIEQHFLVSCLPEQMDLFRLAPSRKGLLLHPDFDELFEVFGFRITAASLPFAYRSP